MKKLLFILSFIAIQGIVAQNPINKTIGEFTELKVYDRIEVNLIKSDENKVVITGKNIEDVVIVNRNGKLKIRMKIDKIFNGDDTFVEVYYTSFDILDANEGAVITVNEIIEQYEIIIKAQEGATVAVGVDVNEVEVRSVTGGIVETRGKAVNQKINLNTGGIYKGKFCETETTKVSIKAAGEAHVNATRLVDANVKVGGDVIIYGKPETVKENKMLGGRIKLHQD